MNQGAEPVDKWIAAQKLHVPQTSPAHDEKRQDHAHHRYQTEIVRQIGS
jgi:hypothetical protein